MNLRGPVMHAFLDAAGWCSVLPAAERWASLTTALPPHAAGGDVCHPLVRLTSILRHTMRLPTAALAGPCASLVGTCTADDVDLAARPPAPLVPTNVRLSCGEVEVMVPGSLSAPISIVRREHPRHPDLQYIALPGNSVLGSYPERPGLPWLVHNRRSQWWGDLLLQLWGVR